MLGRAKLPSGYQKTSKTSRLDLDLQFNFNQTRLKAKSSIPYKILQVQTKLPILHRTIRNVDDLWLKNNRVSPFVSSSFDTRSSKTRSPEDKTWN